MTASGHYIRALAYLNAGEYEQAIEHFTQAIELDPAFSEAYVSRGVAYHSQGNYARAIADYDEAIRLRPDFAEAHYNRGLAYHHQGDLAQAIADFDEAIRQPDDGDAYFSRGWLTTSRRLRVRYDYDGHPAASMMLRSQWPGTSLRSGRLAQAIADYDEAIRLARLCGCLPQPGTGPADRATIRWR
jgi:tetratricopeptide (TPR) repeat protein